MRKSKIRLVRIDRCRLAGSLPENHEIAGFSLVEMLASMAITLIILAVAVATFSGALSTREAENSRTDALTSAQAAINIMTREIANSGYGIQTNGVIVEDCTPQRLHIRANISNNDYTTDDPGEDITFFYDTQSQSVLRFDANTGITSGVINRVSQVEFGYFDYNGTTTNPDNAPYTVPSANTGRVRIKLWVELADVQGQRTGQRVQYSSDVTLRNSPYMLSQY
jgi:prepilin-type N-terminal cleavage/methylation domain-containing protein